MTVSDPFLQDSSATEGAPPAIGAAVRGRWNSTKALKAPAPPPLNIGSSHANPCNFQAMKIST